jgi:ribosomal-protein-alanine N-acetyltransferase
LAARAAWIILPLRHLDWRQGLQPSAFREDAMTTSRESVPTRSSACASQMPVHIRWMIRRDMPEVLAIEEQSFEFPWSEDDFVRCLRQRNCIGMVAEHNERVVGFMIYELHKTRLHILNFAVEQQLRRRGVGSQMVKKLAGKLSPQRRSRIMLEIRETNLPAQLFFRALGFRAVSVLRAFYDDTPEDAYLMQLRYTPAMAAADAGRQTRLAG